MFRIRYLTTAVFLFVGAQAVQRSVVDLDEFGDNEWLKGISTDGDATCHVIQQCIVGSGSGTCKVEVDAARAVPLGSTDSGYDCDFFLGSALNNTMEYRRAGHAIFGHHATTPSSDITMVGNSASSHWNICWRVESDQRAARRDVQDYCYSVNGLCFLWASLCSGGCGNLGALTGSLANPSFATFCPAGLRYATEAEWSAALPTLTADKGAFYGKCAAAQLDPGHEHCDFVNELVRVPDGGYNEQVLVCGDAGATTSASSVAPVVAPPAGATTVSAKGDPHLQNVHGQRFDLMKPGRYVLINVPRQVSAENALLHVQADARRLGGCTDMYFQELNVTGSWAEANQAGGYHHAVSGKAVETPQWVRFGKVELKVVHGHTKRGLEYLNLYVKHLGQTGLSIGGLLGDDDHTVESTLPKECRKRGVALLEYQVDDSSSEAVVTFA